MVHLTIVVNRRAGQRTREGHIRWVYLVTVNGHSAHEHRAWSQVAARYDIPRKPVPKTFPVVYTVRKKV